MMRSHNFHDKLRLPWNYQVLRTLTCRTKLFPSNFYQELQRLATFTQNMKNVIQENDIRNMFFKQDDNAFDKIKAN